ncbi:glucosaminidase domain-containing protein [Colwellia sp. D2M02]|nr:glucosaminidase domain-containing protein [Colwellia sp. D2M02]
MKLFLWLSFLAFLVVTLLAPFTFLVPDNAESSLAKRLIAEQQSQDKERQKSRENKKTVKKVVEQPLHNVDLPDFAAIADVSTKKAQFFDFITPAIVAQNERILATRTKLEYWLEQMTLELGLTEQEEAELQILAKRYRLKKSRSNLQKVNELLVRVDIIPLPLVLVQAANESAWGTSRFSRIGLNFFGIWCYEPDCGMVPNGRNKGAKHEVAAFDSVDDAVRGYFRNINTHNAYQVFRTIRAQLRANNEPIAPEILATGLLPYSERGADYVLDITDMLRHNQRFFEDETTYFDNTTSYSE